MRFFKLILFIVFFISVGSIGAQSDSTLKLNENEWKDLSKDIDYTETFIEKEKKTEETKPNVQNETPTNAFDYSDLKYLIYFLALVVVLILIFLAFRNFKKNNVVLEKTISIETIDEIEEKIHEVNLDDLLAEALKVKNYRIALRLNFLIVIKLLSEKGEINWAKEKTNWEYYAELRNKQIADPFKEIILNFEAIWYGEYVLTELNYHLTEPLYKALQKKLRPNE
jgi:hypothetical protein